MESRRKPPLPVLSNTFRVGWSVCEGDWEGDPEPDGDSDGEAEPEGVADGDPDPEGVAVAE
jgi:hypothetical protein